MFVVTTAIKKLLKLKKRKKIVQGGTSAGKTFGILPILIDRAIRTSNVEISVCLLYTSPSPRDRTRSRMPSSA